MTTTIQIAERYGSYLSSRRLAGELRKYVVMLVEAEGVPEITVDFEGVESISNSFTDGFLGRLVVERGRHWLDRHLRLVGLTQDDRDDVDGILALRQPDTSVAS